MGLTEILVEIAGWMGAILILGGYILVSFGKLTGQSKIYQWMNIFGAIGFTINSGWHGAIPNAALNVIWIGIGVYTLWSVRNAGRKQID